MDGAIPPLPQYAFMAWCSVKKESTGTNLDYPSRLEILPEPWFGHPYNVIIRNPSYVCSVYVYQINVECFPRNYDNDSHVLVA
jgi:hypothetical protein